MAVTQYIYCLVSPPLCINYKKKKKQRSCGVYIWLHLQLQVRFNDIGREGGVVSAEVIEDS